MIGGYFIGQTQQERQSFMARWTQNRNEVYQLVKAQQWLWGALEKGFIINVVLTDNRVFEGYYSGGSAGNNAGTMMPPTSYYGEIALRHLNGTRS